MGTNQSSLDTDTASLPKWKRHYIKRRKKVIEYLGGHCVNCKTIDSLQIDHIDPDSKLFAVSEVLTHAWTKIEPELNKCQLLCKDCHVEKNKTDGSHAKMMHSFANRVPLERDRQGRFKRRQT